jgi:hypothetical protein
MKINLGHGAYLEPDEGPRDTLFHKRIVKVERIANTRVGNWCVLECGHRAMTFGDLTHCGGVLLCMQCRNGEVAQ